VPPPSHPTLPGSRRFAASAALFALLVVAVYGGASAGARPGDGEASVTAARSTSTYLISHSAGGGKPNGASTRPVMSGDKRFIRAIAFESLASNLVRTDRDGVRDVFVTFRGDRATNAGTRWKPGRTFMMSRPATGQAADGPSYKASLDGSIRTKPTCIAFISAASNMVPGDTNGQPDAFLRRLRGGSPKRLVTKGQRPDGPATGVAVSGDCSLIAFTIGGELYVSRRGRRARHVDTAPNAADPSFSTGIRNDLVFAARRGVYLLKNGRGRPKLVGRGGRNPVYNDMRRRTVAYEKKKGRHWQIAYHDIGRRERIISRRRHIGNRDSRNPVIGDFGYFVTFETDATNLDRRPDKNRRPDVYLYTDKRRIALRQTTNKRGRGLRGGGRNPAMNYFANYILFDSPLGLRSGRGKRQIFMHYRGGI
jgi:hypothetical protein